MTTPGILLDPWFCFVYFSIASNPVVLLVGIYGRMYLTNNEVKCEILDRWIDVC